MAEHTPGRLRAGYLDEKDRQQRMVLRAEDADGQPYVAVCLGGCVVSHEANAVRIVAAWNACHDAGLATTALEAGVVQQVFALLAEAIERLPAWAGPNDEAHAWWLRAATLALATGKEP